MRPEDVPQEWMDVGMKAYRADLGSYQKSVKSAIAAAIPLIQAAERDALWRDMPPQAPEDHAEWARGFNFCLDHLKAVIRAREEVK